MAEEKDLSQLVRELVGAVGGYLKERGGELMAQIVLAPLRRAAGKIALLSAGCVLLAMGLIFLSLGVMRVLTTWFGSIMVAYLAAGGFIILVAALIFATAFHSRPGEGRKNDESSQERAGSGGS